MCPIIGKHISKCLYSYVIVPELLLNELLGEKNPKATGDAKTGQILSLITEWACRLV